MSDMTIALPQINGTPIPQYWPREERVEVNITPNRAATSERVWVESVGVGSIIDSDFRQAHDDFVGTRQALSPVGVELQERIKEKWPEILARARELEEQYPDPVQSLIDLFAELPGDTATWEEIYDEPYG